MSAPASGAVYVFVSTGTGWEQQAYIKASNTRPGASFGNSVALEGETLVVSSELESSGATGVNGNQIDQSTPGAGAAYVFVRTGTDWSQQAYVKASNTGPAHFGHSVALSGDMLAVGSDLESSAAANVNGDQGATSDKFGAGAAYVFTRSGTMWTQTAYVKASNPRGNASFGASVALSADTLAVGSNREASNGTGVEGDSSKFVAPNAGAVYVFR
jgi:hypothetical protein